MGAERVGDSGEPAGASRSRRSVRARVITAGDLDAVGRLAGAVAHEFNNLLATISGYAELMREEKADGDPDRPRLDEIRLAAERAIELTRRLLAFGGRQYLRPRPLDLPAWLSGLTPRLGDWLGARVELRFEFGGGPAPAYADPDLLERALEQLARNAADAMPEGGRFTIAVADVEIDGAADLSGLEPGPYVRLTVSDDGIGMGDETLVGAFEPFFSRKPRHGAAAGLGLATVYGIVRQNGGQVVLESGEGAGTSFTIYLPRALAPAARGAPAAAARTEGAAATVMVVDDAEPLRRLMALQLERAGHTVIEAATCEQALATVAACAVDLLVVDVLMPEIAGPDLARRAVALRPGLRVLFVTGYPEHELTDERLGDAEVLLKPFGAAALTEAVRRTLDSVPGGRPRC
jgi:nitrogen-specific signal transduction histidine kinase/ActR/RegA family two-component response regulator